jgi:hypothetical protein
MKCKRIVKFNRAGYIGQDANVNGQHVFAYWSESLASAVTELSVHY